MSLRRQLLIRHLAVALAGCTLLARGEVFDDIAVSTQSLHNGETSHGYLELRVLVENRSAKTTHEITIVYPDVAWSSGNCINRLSRTVSLPPGTQGAVLLWQPPLPANGNGMLRVITDGDVAGRIPVANSRGHLPAGRRSMGYYSQTTILISRSLNFTEIEHVFEGTRKSFTAEMATGAPDSGGRYGLNPAAWTPDLVRPGPHWLELDYSPPLLADRLRIYTSTPSSSSCQVNLIGVSGTNLATLPATLIGVRSGSPSGSSLRPVELTLPTMAEPVKSVRLEFPTSSPHVISIDAVELANSSGSVWAVDARASSDASRSASSYMSPGRPGTVSRTCLRAELPVTEWSDHWLAYSPYDAIVLGGSDVASIPAGVADALSRYAECGGNIIVFGRGRLPETWNLRDETAEGEGRRCRMGFGQCFIFDSGTAITAGSSGVGKMSAAADTLARSLQTLPQDEAANSSFPVVDNLQIPVRGMVFIMLGFVLLIGPVNLIVLSRLKRRTWLLWTIPAISFATCLLVFVYSLAREGITPECRIESVTLLDQTIRRATTIGAEAFYCPLTPNQGLRFDYETEVTPLVGMEMFGAGEARDVDWTQAQQFRRGWLTARVPAHFFLRKSETRRERIQLEGEEEKRFVINGLGVPIRSLWLEDFDGRMYSISEVPAGEKARLPSAAKTLSTGSSVRNVSDVLYKTSYGNHASMLTNNPQACLRPGTYIAQLDGDPFLENGLGSYAKAKKTRTTSVVYGMLDALRSTSSPAISAKP